MAEHAGGLHDLLGQANMKFLELGKLGSGANVLDAGCGSGELAQMAASYIGSTGKVIGVDVSPEMIRVAKERCVDHPNIKLHVHDAHVLRFKAGVCDVVYCRMSLPFFTDPEGFLARAIDVLKPGGRLVLMGFGDAANNEFFGPYREAADGEIARSAALFQEPNLKRALAAAGFGQLRVRSVRALTKVIDPASHWKVVRGVLGIPDREAPAAFAQFSKPDAQLSLELVFGLAFKPDPSAKNTMPLATADDLVAAARRKIREQTPFEISRNFKKQDVTYVDVREPDEWAQGYIPEALKIPRGELETTIVEKQPDIEATIVTCCDDGRRGAMAAARLTDMGYMNVWNLYGGMRAWNDAKMPVKK